VFNPLYECTNNELNTGNEEQINETRLVLAKFQAAYFSPKRKVEK